MTPSRLKTIATNDTGIPPFDTIVSRRFVPQNELVLHHKHIFIVPSLYLLILGAVILLLWVMSVQFLLNLGYLLVFMLTGLLIMAMMHTFRNLDGLKIAVGEIPPVFLGETAGCPFTLTNTTAHDKRMIDVSWGDTTVCAEDIVHQEGTSLTLPFVPQKRGWNSLPRVGLRTFYPLGFFVAWSYFQPAKRLLAFPAPIFSPHPHSLQNTGEDYGAHEVAGRENVVGVRDFVPGDPINLLSWKHLLQRDQWVSKLTTQSTGGRTLMFDWSQSAEVDTERKLSQLCGWLVTAHQNGDAFGLTLPNRTIAVDVGNAHLRQCLEALATY